MSNDPVCEPCGGKGCYECNETGDYRGHWKHIKDLRGDQWPGLRAAILYAAVASIPSEIRRLPWAEFGVWRGNSARFLHRLKPAGVELHLYDSFFQGLPEDWTEEYPKGTFAQDVMPDLPEEEVVIHKGFFKDTLLPSSGVLSFSFIHIDSDLYSSAVTILNRIHSIPGTVIVFDEFSQGEDRALDESGLKYVRLFQTPHDQVAIRLY